MFVCFYFQFSGKWIEKDIAAAYVRKFPVCCDPHSQRFSTVSEEIIACQPTGAGKSGSIQNTIQKLYKNKYKKPKWKQKQTRPIKFKSFCTAKETINKSKRLPKDWEKIFANDVTNKGLVSKFYK